MAGDRGWGRGLESPAKGQGFLMLFHIRKPMEAPEWEGHYRSVFEKDLFGGKKKIPQGSFCGYGNRYVMSTFDWGNGQDPGPEDP